MRFLKAPKDREIVWHDLVKNPDDLPQERGWLTAKQYLCEMQHGLYYAVLKYGKGWNYTTNKETEIPGVTAWAEIPRW